MSFPYYKGQSYAEVIGEQYYIYKGMFIMAATLSLLYSILQYCRVYTKTNYDTHSLQKRVLIITNLMGSTFLIQSIDPQGYSGILPTIVEVLASDLTTYIGLVILFVFINKTNKIVKFCTPSSYWKKEFDYEGIVWIILAVSMLLGSIILSILQVTQNRSIFRGTKLIAFAVMLTCAYIRTNMLLIYVYNHAKGRAINLTRILTYLILFNIIVPVIVITQLAYGILEIVSQDKDTPQLTFDQYLFPLLELIIMLFATTYMSKINPDAHSDTINTPRIIIPNVNGIRPV